MFKRDVLPLDEVLKKLLREEGLEVPLLQKRLVDAWEVVTGNVVSRYTAEKYIRNQTLFVKITNPALRQDLSMMRTQLVKRLNEQVGSFIISDIRILFSSQSFGLSGYVVHDFNFHKSLYSPFQSPSSNNSTAFS